MVVTERRLPRVAMAMLVGAALGVSGAIFQSLMRNPLGSPDVMGLNTGASERRAGRDRGCLSASTAITVTAMTGGILTALVIWLPPGNGIDTFRLIIIGIGVRAMLMAFNTGLPCRFRWKRRCRPGCGMPVPQRPDLGQSLACRAIDSADVYRRAAAGAAYVAAGDDSACALGVGAERSRLDADAGRRVAHCGLLRLPDPSPLSPLLPLTLRVVLAVRFAGA